MEYSDTAPRPPRAAVPNALRGVPNTLRDSVDSVEHTSAYASMHAIEYVFVAVLVAEVAFGVTASGLVEWVHNLLVLRAQKYKY